MQPSLNRLAPVGPVGMYKTYQIKAPISTHFRPATCEEVHCVAYERGWITRLPADDPRCVYIRAQSGRRFTERPSYELDESHNEVVIPGVIDFVFSPGQMCFAAADHRITLHREPLYIVRDGDFRGNPTGRRLQHASGQDWVDDFGEHQNRIAELKERG